MQVIDLSHQISEDIPTYSFIPKPKIGTLFTHKESEKIYKGAVSFEISKIELYTSTGTYLDAPFHRHPNGRKIADIKLEETIGKGVVVDVTGKEPKSKVTVKDIEGKIPEDAEAILFHTGWDEYWETEQYFASPSLDYEVVDFLISRKPKLVGIDGINVDHATHKDKPAHTKLLAQDIFIIENLTNLSQLMGGNFTFFAPPLNIQGIASCPVRAFALVA
jgi:arylformamidase